MGLLHGLFALRYAPSRYALDFLRAADATYAGLTPGHYASLFALAVGGALLWYVRRHGRSPLPAALE